MKSFVLFCTLILSQLSHAEPQCASVQNWLTLSTAFTFETWDIEKNQWVRLQKPDCNDSLYNQLLESLVTLKKLPKLLDLSGTWQSSIIDKHPFDFFKDRAHTIRIDTQPKSSQCSGSNTSVLAYVHDPRDFTIYVCPFLEKNHFINKLGNLIHESKHLMSLEEQQNPKNKNITTYNAHALCLHGVLIGEYGCDNNYSDQGAYATEMEFYLKLARTNEVDSNLKTDAQSTLMTHALSHFNFLPLGKKAGLLLTSLNNSSYFWDSESKKLELITLAPSEKGLLTFRGVPTFYDPVNISVKSFAGTQNWVDTLGAFAQKYILDFSVDEREKLLDVYYGINFACFLFPDKIYCEDVTESATIAIPNNLHPTHFAAMLEPLTGNDFVHLVTQEGQLILLPGHKSLSSWSWADFSETPTFKNFKGVAILPGLKRYALDQQNQLVTYDDPQKLQIVTGTENMKFQKMVGPFYWSPSLMEL